MENIKNAITAALQGIPVSPIKAALEDALQSVPAVPEAIEVFYREALERLEAWRRQQLGLALLRASIGRAEGRERFVFLVEATRETHLYRLPGARLTDLGLGSFQAVVVELPREARLKVLEATARQGRLVRYFLVDPAAPVRDVGLDLGLQLGYPGLEGPLKEE